VSGIAVNIVVGSIIVAAFLRVVSEVIGVFISAVGIGIIAWRRRLVLYEEDPAVAAAPLAATAARSRPAAVAISPAPRGALTLSRPLSSCCDGSCASAL
jgi:hypothetical protein